MTTPTRSYQKVFYTLRPSKQVERRMIIETLQYLMSFGYSILDYQYTGLGSVYFVDFILFHRYLGLDNFLCVEYDQTIANRMEFNQPFGLIDININPIGSVIPTLTDDIKQILWLDYDSKINEAILSDITLSTYKLPIDSIFLITVDIEPPDNRNGPNEWMEYYSIEGGQYFEHYWDVSHFSKSNLFQINYSMIRNAINAGMTGRDETKFFQLFNFNYADGHNMLTLGGLISNNSEKIRSLTKDIKKFQYIRLNNEEEPFKIIVPRITRKERFYLDKNMPCDDDWLPSEFELSHEEVLNYRDIYRYYPMYAELLL